MRVKTKKLMEIEEHSTAYATKTMERKDK